MLFTLQWQRYNFFSFIRLFREIISKKAKIIFLSHQRDFRIPIDVFESKEIVSCKFLSVQRHYKETVS